VNTQLRQQWMRKIELLCQAENWKYAQFLCLEMLYQEPNYVDARRILHRTRQYTFCQQKLQRWLYLFVKFLQALWYAVRIKTKHRQLLATMDELLNIDPNNPHILRLFAETMSGFGFYETTIFSIGCIIEDKRNEDDWLLMGESFLGSEDFQMAVEIANKILAQSPENIRARDLLWQSSVEQSMGTEKI
jgi:tetratricopeptide (TPR) repeat protein